MAGGLLQLVSVTAEDRVLTGQPQFTQWVQVYRTHSGFSVETLSAKLPFAVGRSGEAKVPKAGDLLCGLTLKLQLPVLQASYATTVDERLRQLLANPLAEFNKFIHLYNLHQIEAAQDYLAFLARPNELDSHYAYLDDKSVARTFFPQLLFGDVIKYPTDTVDARRINPNRLRQFATSMQAYLRTAQEVVAYDHRNLLAPSNMEDLVLKLQGMLTLRHKCGIIVQNIKSQLAAPDFAIQTQVDLFEALMAAIETRIVLSDEVRAIDVFNQFPSLTYDRLTIPDSMRGFAASTNKLDIQTYARQPALVLDSTKLRLRAVLRVGTAVPGPDSLLVTGEVVENLDIKELWESTGLSLALVVIKDVTRIGTDRFAVLPVTVVDKDSTMSKVIVRVVSSEPKLKDDVLTQNSIVLVYPGSADGPLVHTLYEGRLILNEPLAAFTVDYENIVEDSKTVGLFPPPNTVADDCHMFMQGAFHAVQHFERTPVALDVRQLIGFIANNPSNRLFSNATLTRLMTANLPRCISENYKTLGAILNALFTDYLTVRGSLIYDADIQQFLRVNQESALNSTLFANFLLKITANRVNGANEFFNVYLDRVSTALDTMRTKVLDSFKSVIINSSSATVDPLMKTIDYIRESIGSNVVVLEHQAPILTQGAVVLRDASGATVPDLTMTMTTIDGTSSLDVCLLQVERVAKLEFEETQLASLKSGNYIGTAAQQVRILFCQLSSDRLLMTIRVAATTLAFTTTEELTAYDETRQVLNIGDRYLMASKTEGRRCSFLEQADGAPIPKWQQLATVVSVNAQQVHTVMTSADFFSFFRKTDSEIVAEPATSNDRYLHYFWLQALLHTGSRLLQDQHGNVINVDPRVSVMLQASFQTRYYFVSEHVKEVERQLRAQENDRVAGRYYLHNVMLMANPLHTDQILQLAHVVVPEAFTESQMAEVTALLGLHPRVVSGRLSGTLSLQADVLMLDHMDFHDRMYYVYDLLCRQSDLDATSATLRITETTPTTPYRLPVATTLLIQQLARELSITTTQPSSATVLEAAQALTDGATRSRCLLVLATYAHIVRQLRECMYGKRTLYKGTLYLMTSQPTASTLVNLVLDDANAGVKIEDRVLLDYLYGFLSQEVASLSYFDPFLRVVNSNADIYYDMVAELLATTQVGTTTDAIRHTLHKLYGFSAESLLAQRNLHANWSSLFATTASSYFNRAIAQLSGIGQLITNSSKTFDNSLVLYNSNLNILRLKQYKYNDIPTYSTLKFRSIIEREVYQQDASGALVAPAQLKAKYSMVNPELFQKAYEEVFEETNSTFRLRVADSVVGTLRSLCTATDDVNMFMVAFYMSNSFVSKRDNLKAALLTHNLNALLAAGKLDASQLTGDHKVVTVLGRKLVVHDLPHAYFAGTTGTGLDAQAKQLVVSTPEILEFCMRAYAALPLSEQTLVRQLWEDENRIKRQLWNRLYELNTLSGTLAAVQFDPTQPIVVAKRVYYVLDGTLVTDTELQALRRGTYVGKSLASFNGRWVRTTALPDEFSVQVESNGQLLVRRRHTFDEVWVAMQRQLAMVQRVQRFEAEYISYSTDVADGSGNVMISGQLDREHAIVKYMSPESENTRLINTAAVPSTYSLVHAAQVVTTLTHNNTLVLAGTYASRDSVRFYSSDQTFKQMSADLPAAGSFVAAYTADARGVLTFRYVMAIGGAGDETVTALVVCPSFGHMLIAGNFSSGDAAVYSLTSDGATYTKSRFYRNDVKPDHVQKGGFVLRASISTGVIIQDANTSDQPWIVLLEGSPSLEVRSVCCVEGSSVFLTGSYLHSASGQTPQLHAPVYAQSIAAPTFVIDATAFVCKFDFTSGVPRWVTVIDDFDDDEGSSIDVDPDGNVFVVGKYSLSEADAKAYSVPAGSEAPMDASSNFVRMPAAVMYACFLVKYSSDGVVVWVRHIDGSDEEINHHVRCTRGSVFVAGSYSSKDGFAYSGDARTGIALPACTSAGTFLVCYTSDGEPSWATNIDGAGFDVPTQLRLIKNYLYVCGTTTSPSLVAASARSSRTVAMQNTTTTSYYVCRYDRSGTLISAFNIEGAGVDKAIDVAVVDNTTYAIGAHGAGSLLTRSYIVDTTVPLETTATSGSFIVKYDDVPDNTNEEFTSGTLHLVSHMQWAAKALTIDFGETFDQVLEAYYLDFEYNGSRNLAPVSSFTSSNGATVMRAVPDAMYYPLLHEAFPTPRVLHLKYQRGTDILEARCGILTHPGQVWTRIYAPHDSLVESAEFGLLCFTDAGLNVPFHGTTYMVKDFYDKLSLHQMLRLMPHLQTFRQDIDAVFNRYDSSRVYNIVTQAGLTHRQLLRFILDDVVTSDVLFSSLHQLLGIKQYRAKLITPSVRTAVAGLLRVQPLSPLVTVDVSGGRMGLLAAISSVLRVARASSWQSLARADLASPPATPPIESCSPGFGVPLLQRVIGHYAHALRSYEDALLRQDYAAIPESATATATFELSASVTHERLMEAVNAEPDYPDYGEQQIEHYYDTLHFIVRPNEVANFEDERYQTSDGQSQLAFRLASLAAEQSSNLQGLYRLFGESVRNTVSRPQVPMCRWVSYLGEFLLENCALAIGSSTINEVRDDWMHIHNRLLVPHAKQGTLDKMVGHVYGLTCFKKQHESDVLYIRLPFYLNNPGLALPLIALSQSDVFVRWTCRALQDLVLTNSPDVSLHAVQSMSAELLYDVVYLDERERTLFGESKHEYLIEQPVVAARALVVGDEADLLLSLSQPVRDLFYFAQTPGKSYYNYCTEPYVPATTDDYVRQLELVLQSGARPAVMAAVERLATQRGVTFGSDMAMVYDALRHGYMRDMLREAMDNYDARVRQGWILHSTLETGGRARYSLPAGMTGEVAATQYYHASLDGLHTYSFAREPTQYQPSGSFNMGILPNNRLKLKLAAAATATEPAVVKVYARCYNFLRVMSGHGAVVM